MDKKLIETLLEQATAQGAEFAEVFYEEKYVDTSALEQGNIDEVYSATISGVGIRVLNGNEMSYGHTNDLDKENLISLAKKVGEGFTGEEKRFQLKNKEITPKLSLQERFDVEQQIDLLKTGAEVLKDEPYLKQASLSISDVAQKVIIANTEGVYVEDNRTRRRANARVILEREGELQTGYASLGVTGTSLLFEEKTFNELCHSAYEHGKNLLFAKACKGGSYPVIMSSSAGGTMIHEACGHGLEADLVERGISAYKDKLETQVANALITVIDAGNIKGKFGSSCYDDEGYKTQETVLIEDGILKQYMCDLHTSKKTGFCQTGNGRRESYAKKPQTRMTTTYIKPGNDNPEDIIKEIKEGLLVTKMGGGQVDVLSGDYVFDVSEGYWIVDGEVAHTVRGATLAGNGPKSLNDVTRLGNDLGFAIGVCGKGGQGAPVTDAQPTMRIENLIIGGVVSDETIIS